MVNSLFQETKIGLTNIQRSSFNGSTFSFLEMKEINISGSDFNDVTFSKCVLQQVKSDTLTDTKGVAFDDCKLTDVEGFVK